MKFLQSPGDELTLPLAPLIDIIFLLIIFFLISSSFEKGENSLGIHLPAAAGRNDPADAKPLSWTFNIRMDGTIIFENKMVTREGITGLLLTNQSRRSSVQVVLRADERVPYGVVIKLLGQFNQHGYQKVAFKTTRENNAGQP